MATILDFCQLVQAQIGVPYVFGGTSLAGTAHPGLDCSGLPYAVAAHFGVTIPRTSEAQFAGLPNVPLNGLRQGDLVFYDVASDPQPQPAHEAVVWVPGQQVIQAPHTGAVVEFSPLAIYPIMGYRRVPFPDPPGPPPPVPTPTTGDDDVITALEAFGQTHVFHATTGGIRHNWQTTGGGPWQGENLLTPGNPLDLIAFNIAGQIHVWADLGTQVTHFWQGLGTDWTSEQII